MSFWLQGMLAGAWLSQLRLGLGHDAAHWLAVDPGRALVLRGLALLGLALWVQRHAVRLAERGGLTRCCFAAALGYAAHALLIQPRFALAHFGLGALLALGGAALVLLRSKAERGSGATSAAQPVSAGATERAGLGERCGLLLAGAGAALALESVARGLRLYGTSSSFEEAVVAVALLALLGAGALAFGRPFAGARALAPLGLVGGALACFFSQRFLAQLGEPDALSGYARRYGLDLSQIGSAQFGFLLASSACVLPGFALGAGLAGAAKRQALGAVLAGAALGPLLIWALPRAYYLVDLELARAGAGHTLPQRMGALMAACGALLALAGALIPSRGRARAIAATVAAGLSLLLAWLLPTRLALPLSPWLSVPVELVGAVLTPEGLATVEQLPDGTRIATLDRVRLTPDSSEEEADEQRLALAIELAGGGGPDLRVEFLGLLTPARSAALRRLGVEHVHRPSGFPLGLALLEHALFEPEAAPRPRPLPEDEQGRVLRFAPPLLGAYLVGLAAQRPPLAEPPAQAWPLLAAASDESSASVLWIDASAPLAGVALGEHVVVSLARFEQLAFGVLGGAARERAQLSEAVRALPVQGPSARRAIAAQWEQLRTLPRMSADSERARSAQRLAAAADSEDANAEPRVRARVQLARGLGELYAAQRWSSPWESAAQRVELPEGALERLRSAALEPRPDLSTRALWSELARVLAGKRMPDLVLAHCLPLAQAWPNWPELEAALAEAYLEYAMPAEALAALERQLADAPYDIELMLRAARAAELAGLHAQQADFVRRALALQSDRPDLRRLLGLALARLGDPAASALLEEALALDPADEEVANFLRAGVLPPIERAFEPANAHEHDEHGHAGEHSEHATPQSSAPAAPASAPSSAPAAPAAIPAPG
jgi:hypothetical protein